jgi:type VI protein secretion system component VasF
MSQKRKLDQVAEVESADASDASSASTTKKSRPHAKKHKRPTNKDDGYGASASALKNRIRDLKRLLAHVENVPKHKMSAGARIERERELEACEHELAEKTMKAHESEHRKKMIGKYHQVRFFGKSAEFLMFS